MTFASSRIRAGGRYWSVIRAPNGNKASSMAFVIAAGAKASALLRQPEAGNFPPATCKITTADRLRVYPPGETQPLFVHDAEQVCASGVGRGGVMPVVAGDGSNDG